MLFQSAFAGGWLKESIIWRKVLYLNPLGLFLLRKSGLANVKISLKNKCQNQKKVAFNICPANSSR